MRGSWVLSNPVTYTVFVGLIVFSLHRTYIIYSQYRDLRYILDSILPSYIAMQKLQSGGSYLDAVVVGCTECEIEQCDHSVGYGGRYKHTLCCE